jgi:hypothetical protein
LDLVRERTRAAIHPEQAQMQEWLMKARDESREGLAATNGQSDRSAGRAISVSFFALSINKQLDLQSALTSWAASSRMLVDGMSSFELCRSTQLPA